MHTPEKRLLQLAGVAIVLLVVSRWLDPEMYIS